jgi:MSHA biogenesis protein MshN
MSLINKMLQDLDARGGAREEGLRQQELKAVPAGERDRRPLLLAGAGIGVAALVAAAVAGWYHWQSVRAPAGPVPLMVQAAPAAQPVPTTAPAVVSAATAPVAPAAPQTVPATPATPAAPPLAADVAPPTATARRARAADTAEVHAAPAVQAARPAVRNVDPAATARSDLTPKQLSENTYRRALASLQDGRVSTAMADLDRALEIDPRNEAARQTYVSLLLEQRRPDDAIRQLRLALGIDPRQPGLAMVLARLQLERGGPALQTLMTTLPHAAASADYQAFLAGVLQREGRHAEAAQYYQAALKLSPLNGVWWMGLGISLQADQHRAEAREAFSRARTGDGITPELLAFINRRIDQLPPAQH